MKRKINLKKAGYWTSMVTLGLVVGISLQLVRANWIAPTSPAPDGNVGAPINTGDNSQNKAGTLGIGKNLAVGIGTPTTVAAPNGSAAGNVYANDFYIASADKWASQLGGGGSSAPLDGSVAKVSTSVSYPTFNGGSYVSYTTLHYGVVTGYAKYEGGIYYTRSTGSGDGFSSCDTGWVKGDDASCSISASYYTWTSHAHHVSLGVVNTVTRNAGSLTDTSTYTGVWNK